MIMDIQGPTTILVDIEEKKVGCVILQAALGGNRNIAMNIKTERWFLAPTKNMKVYTLKNKEEIQKFIDIFNSLEDEGTDR